MKSLIQIQNKRLQKRKSGFLICTIVILIAGCSRAPSSASKPAEHVPAPWSYDGENGTARWNKLDNEYATCGFGTTQSPVDITNPEPQDLPGIVFHYQSSKLDVENTGHTIQVNLDEGSSIEVNGETYDLVQLQFHAPSEHRIRGKPADAEIHLIHRNASGQLAIIAVLLRVGMEDDALRLLWDNLPSVTGAHKTIEERIQLERILPSNRRTFRYDGSLTYPPCSEIVTWLVMRDSMHISAKQLAGFSAMFGNNNRPVQPLNQRTVIQDTPK